VRRVRRERERDLPPRAARRQARGGRRFVRRVGVHAQCRLGLRRARERACGRARGAAGEGGASVTRAQLCAARRSSGSSPARARRRVISGHAAAAAAVAR
jgi:hypothetical protein